MSKQVLELLRAVSFLETDNSVANLEGIPEQQIKRRLAYYYNSRRQTAKRELTDLINSKLEHSALISGVSAANAVIPLCPKFLVQESLIVSDPLFTFAMPENEITKVEKQGLGMANVGSMDFVQLTNELKYFSALAPYIEAGFLYALPLGLLHEPPQKLPINFPRNRYRELVPPDAVEFVRRAAIVRPFERSGDGLIILPEPNTRLKRHVSITFEGDEAANGAPFGASFYNFREVEFEKENADGSYTISWQFWSDEPLEKAQYDIWIEQSVNKTIGERLKRISKEMRIADAVGAPYLTESTFEAELLAGSGHPTSSNRAAAINFLQANAQLLNLEDPKAIFRLRTDNAELFNRFRLSLAAVVEDLKGLAGQEFEQRAHQLFEQEIQPQIEEVNSAIGRLEGAAAKGLIQTSAALILGLLTGSALPVAAMLVFAAAGMGGEALPAVGDYQRARKQPQFIWHKLKK
jgi:hypothetical protein